MKIFNFSFKNLPVIPPLVKGVRGICHSFCQPSRRSGQAMVEYVIALFLCAIVAAGTFKMYQSVMRIHYNKVARARTGMSGMWP